MPGQAISADLSNAPTIQAAVLDIAQNHAGITWWGTKSGDLPRGIDVQGFPYLAVSNPAMAGGMSGPTMVGSELPREPMVSEPVWDFAVVGIWPYHPGDSRTYSTTENAMLHLVQAFTIYWTLEDTCEQSKIREVEYEPRVIKLRGGHRFYACRLVVRAWEQLLVQYN